MEAHRYKIVTDNQGRLVNHTWDQINETPDAFSVYVIITDNPATPIYVGQTYRGFRRNLLAFAVNYKHGDCYRWRDLVPCSSFLVAHFRHDQFSCDDVRKSVEFDLIEFLEVKGFRLMESATQKVKESQSYPEIVNEIIRKLIQEFSVRELNS